MIIELKGNQININKLYLFYVFIILGDDLIVREKELYCSNEIREGI